MKSKEQKAKESQQRAEKFQSLTPQARWALLDERLGKNLGAKRQRAKLIDECPDLNPVVIQPIKKIVAVQQPVAKPRIPNGSKIILRDRV